MNDLNFISVIITLTNGLRVANFSSNYSFKFTDGSVLPAISNEFCTKLSMEPYEYKFRYSTYGKDSDCFESIKLSFNAASDVIDSINYWYNLWNIEQLVDIVIVPLPVITMMRNSMNWDDDRIYCSPFRTIRVADRLTKKICIDKFCI